MITTRLRDKLGGITMLKQAVKYVVGSAISGHIVRKCYVGGVMCLLGSVAGVAVDDPKVAELINVETADWDVTGEFVEGGKEVVRSEWRKGIEVYVLDNGAYFSRDIFKRVFDGDPSRYDIVLNGDESVVAFYKESGDLVGFMPIILDGETIGSLLNKREGESCGH